MTATEPTEMPAPTTASSPAAGTVFCEGLEPEHEDYEARDDGNEDDDDDCVSGCVEAVCGDGFIHGENEACDDADGDNDDDRLADCRDASCGDGFVHIGVEDCDDNNLVPGDGCDGECQSEVEFQGAGDEAVAEGIAFARYTWAQAGTNNNGRAKRGGCLSTTGWAPCSAEQPSPVGRFYSLITRDSYGWWMGGHNNFSCGNATPGVRRPIQQD